MLKKLKAAFVVGLLLLSVSELHLVTSANAESAPPRDFLTLSVCADTYASKQTFICVPKGESYKAELSEKNVSKGLSHNIVSNGDVIVPQTSKIISLSQLPAASYEWQLLSKAMNGTPEVLRRVKFRIVDLTLELQSKSKIKPTIESTFLESYVLFYEDKSLENLLTNNFGVSGEQLKTESLISSRTKKSTVSKDSKKLIKVNLTKNQFIQLSADNRVLSIEKNMIRSLSTIQNSAPWNLDRLDQESLPLNNSFSYAIGPVTPVIYVLDTGLNQTHTEFSSRISDCWWFPSMTSTCTDYHGHGTHVSGTALGTKYGVAKNAQLQFVKITYDDGSTSHFSITNAIRDIVDIHAEYHPGQPAVLNLSFGCYEYCSTDATDRYYFNRLVQEGIFPVVAAGNVDDDACYYAFGDLGDSPYDYAIVVGATWVNGNTDQRSWYSNYGPCVTLYAPGGAANGDTSKAIASAGISSNTAVSYKSGTSMASPLVAGVIANYLSSFPNKTFVQIHDWLLANARNNKIVDLPSGSVNKLVSIYKLAGPKTAQTITFNAPASIALSTATLTLSASSSSQLSVSFVVADPSVCTVAGSTLTLIKVGTCSITASQAGNDTFAPAREVRKSIRVVAG